MCYDESSKKLFRVSNKIAINFYRKLGYTVYRTVLQYYSGDNDEDA